VQRCHSGGGGTVVVMTRSRIIAAAAGAATFVLMAVTVSAFAAIDDDTVTGGTLVSNLTRGSTAGSTPGSTSSSASSIVPSSPDSSSSTSPAVPAPADPIAVSSQEAIRIALAHVGGGTVAEVERELEHGRLEWKIRILNAGQRFDVRVDAGTGAVTRVDADSRRR
jgi:Peptidase propeptide and YPEB domain